MKIECWKHVIAFNLIIKPVILEEKKSKLKQIKHDFVSNKWVK